MAESKTILKTVWYKNTKGIRRMESNHFERAQWKRTLDEWNDMLEQDRTWESSPHTVLIVLKS
ncbi:hypothetical protein [Metabacillus halosaccharovorans]|uniref:hypothetical protein n=1 Tax=Metabacillus halosaccharovorans TaxID=930124 RepID=UPI0037363AC0